MGGLARLQDLVVDLRLTPSPRRGEGWGEGERATASVERP